MSETTLNGLRILVVEDTLLVAEVVCDHLQDSGCFVVGPVGRLADAVRHAREDALDGALLDLNLGGQLSFPVAAALRARDVPFAFVTGYDAMGVVPEEYREIPRLAKPFDPSDLVELLNEFCRKHKHQSALRK